MAMPYAEPYQDNLHHQPWAGYNIGHKRSAVAEPPFIEYDPSLRRWRQGRRVLYGYRPRRFLCRPHDGKRPGAWGRFKDVLTGEGADVFMTESGDKRTRLRDRPQRHQWTGWGLSHDEQLDRVRFDKDFRWQDTEPIRETGRSYAARVGRPWYDFNRRRFLRVGEVAMQPETVLRDAHWRQGAKRDEVMPYAWQLPYGERYHVVPPWAGLYPGGRPKV